MQRINAAFAIDKADEIGSIEVDKKADIVLYEVPSYDYIPYSFGDNLAKIVIKNGKIVKFRCYGISYNQLEIINFGYA